MKKTKKMKLTTAIIAVIIAAMMATPAFAETRLCGEVPTWEDDSQYPELEPAIEASPEYGVIANEFGDEAYFPADPAFYESGEDDDFRDMGEEMDAAAESVGLPTREEIANEYEEWAAGQIGIWDLIDLQIEEAIEGVDDPFEQRNIANDIIYNAVGDEYAAP